MKLKVLVIELGIKNAANLKKNLKGKNIDFLFASSFLDVVDIIHLDKVHVILFSDFRGVKSTVGYIKMFKTTNPDFKLVILSNEKKLNEESRTYYIQRGVEYYISGYDIGGLNNFFIKNLSRFLNEEQILTEWSRCTKKAIRSLKNNYHIADNILDYIVKESNYSASAISHCVKRDTGESFMDWVQKLRVGGAVELLKSSEYSLSEISNKVGYKTNQGLTKAFKKFTGKTPAFYRKKLD